jgi:proteasome accessory factor C
MKSHMTEQQKIYRTLKLIGILSNGRGATIPSLSQSLEVSDRTLYRYLNLLESLGYIIEKDFYHRYFIASDVDYSVFPFSIEEVELISQLLSTIANKNNLVPDILKKLHHQSPLKPIAEHMDRVRISRNVDILNAAISLKKQVVLINYHSANSNDVRDRLVEPIRITKDYQFLTAFDTEDRKTKYFKIERIADIKPLDSGFKFKDKHREIRQDMFGYSHEKETYVEMILSMRAAMLLREEYPMSIPYLTQMEDGKYHFFGPVRGFEAVGRFTLGLAGDIDVRGPGEFKDYLNEKLNRFRV